ncbi:hypothetical protein [Haloferax sulfurifontis]|uniref:Uncharacterized protein n=1 Tax=Haloferax sulfurifontis TaxID=255616 RepID=A0A830E4J8_9EURY|nr:hypothetical protein [Haloferax sulfurifontis]GGC49889.1 hypothetical protein GCM10007209_09440 [Haloferax sulfurifontis]
MVDWSRGEPVPSLRERVIQVLEENEGAIWTPAEMRGELFPELEFPTGSSIDVEYIMHAQIINQKTALITSVMESLVEEGILDKRRFRVDTIAEITRNEAEYEQVAEKMGDEAVFDDRIYYRLNEGALD